MKRKKGVLDFMRRHPLLASVLVSEPVGMVGAAVLSMPGIVADLFRGRPRIGDIFLSVASGAMLGPFVVFPVTLVVAEIVLMFACRGDDELYRRGRILDVTGVLLGVLYSYLYLGLIDSVIFGADWQQVLYNAQRHTPIYTRSMPTIAVLALVGIAGYLLVNFVPLKKLPPLALVPGMAAMYLGVAESVLWGVQVFGGSLPEDLYLLLFPAGCIVAVARTVMYKVGEWKRLQREPREENSLLRACNDYLMRSERWPVAALILMWPLLGILIGILALFGQAPDAVIRAFTETGGWNLSQRVSPQNLYYDEHYLCTVAAGGHENVVKPKRLGVRHGHEVIVNRQLCIANAFEQVLEERTPRLHRAVRTFYDRYGFPVAGLIRSKYAADAVYFLMKPLEWIFLAVLYLTDVNPENRIAIQYTGRSLKDFDIRE